MICQFAEFTLDEGRRELRLRGREIPLQPRIFDLLAYLVRHRDRTVAKDELLDALWSDVVVGEGSLQRAVSLARAALRQGGLPDAIRTHARKGYRFQAEVREIEIVPDRDERPASLVRAREAYERCAWLEAAEAFREADRAAALSAADLERWADAARLISAGNETEVLQRAVVAHSAAGDRLGAARAATALGLSELERRELAVARGWSRRAATLLENLPECRAHGLQTWLESRIALFEGREDDALRLAEDVLELGRRIDEPDVQVLGLLYRGLVLLARGQTRLAAELQDEAAATALTGDVSPWVAGQVYCGVVWNCRNSGDWDRAAQWTERFTRWCAQLGVDSLPGTCRLHRAEVLSVRGQLDEARREIAASCRRLGELSHWAAGDANRVLGDLLRTTGDLAGAERAYREAYGLGWDPQPGLALVQAATGRGDAAVAGLERALEDPNWSSRQRRGWLLAHLVVVALEAGRPDRARAAIGELEGNPDLWQTPALEAAVDRARAELAAAEGDPAGAIRWLRRAVDGWRTVGSPTQIADHRRRLAAVLIDEGDLDAAILELDSAESTAADLGLAGVEAECRRLRESISRA